MIVTRHVSLDNDCVEKMEPFVEKHGGNFSAAIREIINQAGRSGLPYNASAMDVSLCEWLLEQLDGVLIPQNIVDRMLDPVLMNSMSELEDYVNQRFSELEWEVNVALTYDNNSSPTSVVIELEGTRHKIRFAACLLSQFFVKNSLEHTLLVIKSVTNFDKCMRVELSGIGEKEVFGESSCSVFPGRFGILPESRKKEATDSLIHFFGGMEEVLKTIKSSPEFWKSLIKRHRLSNYNMVTVHRNYLEDLLAGKVAMGEITIENLAKKPIQDIPLKEMLSLIKEVYETSRVADKVEIDQDSIILYHSYRNRDAVEKLRKSLVMLLDANGHIYDAKCTANMIVLTHQPEVGKKVSEVIDNLKTDSSLDHELTLFLTFLNGLKTMPDVSSSMTSLGRRIGKSLMQEYEKEHGIKEWDIERFKGAIKAVDSTIHKESEWKISGNNVLYTIKKCNILMEEDTFDTHICHVIREAFKGALSYAFGSRAELEVKKLLTHGDNFCEVCIKLR